MLLLEVIAAQADFSVLHTSSDWGAARGAIPIVFLSLTYHDLVPVLCAYLGRDRTRIRIALGLGSLVPLCMFVTWTAVALALNPSDGGARHV